MPSLPSTTIARLCRRNQRWKSKPCRSFGSSWNTMLLSTTSSASWEIDSPSDMSSILFFPSYADKLQYRSFPTRSGDHSTRFEVLGTTWSTRDSAATRSPHSRQRRDCVPRSSAASMRSSRSEEHTSELQSQFHLVCRLLLEKKKK